LNAHQWIGDFSLVESLLASTSMAADASPEKAGVGFDPVSGHHLESIS
jgi:hypothetical protein